MAYRSIRAIAFVFRCAGAATAALELASVLGLPESLWAAMSAVVVSQEHLHETRSSLAGRILGTLLGVGVTVAVGKFASWTATSTVVQMTIAVGICALVVLKLPKLRVAMWTCPIILLTAEPSVPITMVALCRASEVILGAFVGGVFHWAAEFVVDMLIAVAPSLRRRHASHYSRVRSESKRHIEDD
jgi:uncharacterized membrane protein YccC